MGRPRVRSQSSYRSADYMPPRKKTRSQRPSAKGKRRHGYRLAGAVLFLLGFLLISLILLAEMRQSWRSSSPVPAPPPAATPPAATHEELLADLRVEVESALLRGGISLADLQVTEREGVLRVKIRGAFLDASITDELRHRLERVSAGISLRVLPKEKELHVLRQGELKLLLLFAPPTEVRPPQRKPHLAIIMDDLGRDLKTAKALLDIDLPVTFAVLPWETEALRVAALGHSRGREILIHLPMEPKSYPVTDPGPHALLLELPAEEIERRFRGFLERVPHAVGGNNHMGSRFTEDRPAMTAILSLLKESNLFFVDSMTTNGSVGMDEAQRLGIRAVARDLFLDNVQETERIAQEIRRLAVLAGRKGQAVGICHPYPETLEALRREAPRLKEMGIEVVPVSKLVNRNP